MAFRYQKYPLQRPARRPGVVFSPALLEESHIARPSYEYRQPDADDDRRQGEIDSRPIVSKLRSAP